MIPNDLNPNTFYRSYNDYAQLHGAARALQGRIALQALGALHRRLAGAIAGAAAGWRAARADRHHHGKGGLHPGAA